MSESIETAKSPPRPLGSDPQNSKWFHTLLTAIVPAIVSIAVAFIAIVPQLRSADAQKLAEVTQRLNSLKEEKNTVAVDSSVLSDKDITGTVKSSDGLQTLSGVEVYLVPSDNKLTAKTDDLGRFTFKQIPRGTYQIIVRDSTPPGKSGRGLLDETENEVHVSGATVKYRMKQ